MDEDRDDTRILLLGEVVFDPALAAMHAQHVDWLLEEASPDDRPRVMMGWNWDNPLTIPSWIIHRSDCDKATLLLAFWNAQPEYSLRYRGDRDAVPVFERASYDFAAEARRLFLAAVTRRRTSLSGSMILAPGRAIFRRSTRNTGSLRGSNCRRRCGFRRLAGSSPTTTSSMASPPPSGRPNCVERSRP